MTGDWLNRNIADDVSPGDIPYRTTDPIPDGDSDETTRLVEDYYGTGPYRTSGDYYGTWHTDPEDKPLPLRTKLYAALFIVLVLGAAAFGIWRGLHG